MVGRGVGGAGFLDAVASTKFFVVVLTAAAGCLTGAMDEAGSLVGAGLF
jgi:hypothetical protein